MMFSYRSLSFHESHPDLELIRLGRRLGFNDLTFQTEKGTMPRLEDLAKRAEAGGWFRLARELGMTVTVWTHELNELDPEWVAICPNNVKVWDGIERRYRYVLDELLPEIDNLCLTVVESAHDTANRRLLIELVKRLNRLCRQRDKRLILRSFVHHPDQAAEVTSVLADLPTEVSVLTKAVPQDWHLRHIDNPLIGAVQGREQFVEEDIAGEYFWEDRVANCFTNVLERRFRHWQQHGVAGLSVRVDRGWAPRVRQARILHRPQEANLWALGYLAADKGTVEDAWRDYSRERFGPAAEAMTRALRPTGKVIGEALCVGRESFGCPRHIHPIQAVLRHRPGQKWGVQRNREARAEEMLKREDELVINPFHNYWSVFRWDPSFRDEYEALRRADPAVIERNRETLARAAELAEQCLRDFEAAADTLDPRQARLLRFLLEENRLRLEAGGGMQQAWLTGARSVLADGPAEKEEYRQRCREHLDRLDELRVAHESRKVAGEWAGRAYHLVRFEGIDLAGFIVDMRRYFQLAP
ncbi:MAG: hypothetical protein ACOC93_00460 [Planctomycetota bacterium]